MDMINQARKLINIDPELVIGSRKAAEILGVSEREVRAKIKRGTLPAAKYGRKYLLNRDAVEFYQGLRAILKNDISVAAVQSGDKAGVRNNPIQNNSVSSTFDLPSANNWPPIYPNAVRKLWPV
jgi:excisionase family DNA binding protein